MWCVRNRQYCTPFQVKYSVYKFYTMDFTDIPWKTRKIIASPKPKLTLVLVKKTSQIKRKIRKRSHFEYLTCGVIALSQCLLFHTREWPAPPTRLGPVQGLCGPRHTPDVRMTSTWRWECGIGGTNLARGHSETHVGGEGVLFAGAGH